MCHLFYVSYKSIKMLNAGKYQKRASGFEESQKNPKIKNKNQ